MASDKQMAANRENAQHSTGPGTDAGKEAVSKNSTKHGLTGTFMFFNEQDRERYYHLLGEMMSDHQANTFTEIELVSKMTESLWRSQRAVELQDQCIDDIQGGDEYEAAEARKNLDLYIRYQASHDRAYQRYAAELRKLQAEFKKAEIGFVSQKAREAQKERAQAQEARRESHESRRQQRHVNTVALDKARIEYQQLLNRKLACDVMQTERSNEAQFSENYLSENALAA